MESSNDSTSSQDELDMRRSNSRARGSRTPSAHRLHPSHSRRTSDSSINLYSFSGTAKGTSSAVYTRDSRPPPSMRGFGSIPAIAAMSPLTALPGHLRTHSAVSQSGVNLSLSSGSTTPIAHPNSPIPASSLNMTAARHAASAPTTPAANTASMAEYTLSCPPRNGTDSQSASLSTNTSPPLDIGVKVAQTTSRPVGNTEISSDEKNGCRSVNAGHDKLITLQKTQTEIQAPFNKHQRMDRGCVPPPLPHVDLANVFPEQAGPPVTLAPDGKSKKLSKGSGAKLLKKKNRWSNSKVAAIAV